MYKDFDHWNEKKKAIESRFSNIIFRERDIWWCSVGINVGNESCGKGKDFRRPVLVLKRLSKDCFIGVPISTKQKNGNWFCMINTEFGIRYALLYQVRMFSINRFQHRFAVLDKQNHKILKQKLKNLLEL